MVRRRGRDFQWWASEGVHETCRFGRVIVTLYLCLDAWEWGPQEYGMIVGARGFGLGPLRVDWLPRAAWAALQARYLELERDERISWDLT